MCISRLCFLSHAYELFECYLVGYVLFVASFAQLYMHNNLYMCEVNKIYQTSCQASLIYMRKSVLFCVSV